MAPAFNLQDSAHTMLAYAKSMLATDPHTHRAKPWSSRFIASIQREREAIRVEDGGGGMCHIVSELLWDRHGWARFPVTYLDPEGQIICAGHLINILPDGGLLDATADQFGEGHDVRVLAPGSPDYGRYRPEFDEEFNPSRYECVAHFFWNGLSDCDAQDRLRANRGQGWWLPDKTDYLAYLQHQVELGGSCYSATVEALQGNR